jgi:hypothetical protein
MMKTEYRVFIKLLAYDHGGRRREDRRPLEAQGCWSEGTSPVSTQMSATGSHFTGKMGLMPEPR